MINLPLGFIHILISQMKLVTPSALVERLKINSSLARAACKFLAEVRVSQLISIIVDEPHRGNFVSFFFLGG